MDQQMQAEEHLKSLSQQTHYIKEWVDKKVKPTPKRKNYETIQEKEEESKQCQIFAKKIQHNRNKNHTEDVKKEEKRQKLINEIENHLVNDNLFINQDHYVSPRYRQGSSNDNSIKAAIEKHHESSGNIYKVIEDEFIKAKLQFFRRKHSQSQQKIINFICHNKSRNRLNSLSIQKKKKIKDSAFKQRSSIHELNSEQITRLKKIVSSERKLSVAQLPKLQMFIPSNYKVRDYL